MLYFKENCFVVEHSEGLKRPYLQSFNCTYNKGCCKQRDHALCKPPTVISSSGRGTRVSDWHLVTWVVPHWWGREYIKDDFSTIWNLTDSKLKALKAIMPLVKNFPGIVRALLSKAPRTHSSAHLLRAKGPLHHYVSCLPGSRQSRESSSFICSTFSLPLMPQYKCNLLKIKNIGFTFHQDEKWSLILIFSPALSSPSFLHCTAGHCY